jgi:bifunctional non-homologous end joining protein LigD
MSKAFDFCIPTRGTEVPAGPDWLHEIKYDGYRLRVERDGDRVRLITRNGYDWTKRYPWIVESALKNRQKHFVIDGEAVVLGVDGVSDFDALHFGKHNDEVQLYAFDMLAGDGDDMRSLPLSMRKANLDRLLARRPDGIFVAPFEQGEIGPDLFWAACNLGLEGLVSKRRDGAYRSGRSPNWIKVKNRSHPAMNRVRDAFLCKTFPASCLNLTGVHCDGVACASELDPLDCAERRRSNRLSRAQRLRLVRPRLLRDR